jgi:hypothetical protein
VINIVKIFIKVNCVTVLFLIGTSSCSLNNKDGGNVSQSPLNLGNQGIKEIRDDSAKDSKKQPIYEPAFNPVELKANDQNSLLEWIRHENIPAWVRNTFFKQGLSKRYTFYFRDIRPLYLRGDFNGDNQIDVAVMLKEKMSQNKIHRNPLMAIFHGGTQQVFFIGPEDLPADDLWEVVPKEENSAKAGEDIFMGKAMSSSKLFYWDGKQYRSSWIGD